MGSWLNYCLDARRLGFDSDGGRVAGGRRQAAGKKTWILLARENRSLFATSWEDPFQDHSKMAKQLHALFPFALVMSGALAFAQSNAPALPNTGQDLTPFGTFVPMNPGIEDLPNGRLRTR